MTSHPKRSGVLEEVSGSVFWASIGECSRRVRCMGEWSPVAPQVSQRIEHRLEWPSTVPRRYAGASSAHPLPPGGVSFGGRRPSRGTSAGET